MADPGSATSRDSSHIVCWGELLWDLFADGPRLGGAAANVAYHVSLLGSRVRLVSRVGQDDLGESALTILREAGVDVKLVQTDAERPTGTVTVQLQSGEPRFTIVEQVAWDRIDFSADVAHAVSSASAIIYGTIAQRTPLGFGALRSALRAAGSGCVRVCDLNVRPPFVARDVIDASLTDADVVKLTDSEADALRELFGVDDPVDWLLEERGIELVALTRGQHGCLLRSRTECHEHPGFPLADAGSGDRVGAGDAFAAVLATGLVRGTDLRTLAVRANRYAGYVASQRGATPPVPKELLAQLAD
jgi:fructokinase